MLLSKYISSTAFLPMTVGDFEHQNSDVGRAICVY